MEKKVKVITDSTCDLSQDAIDKYNIEVIPLVITIDGKSYFDGVDIKLPEFLEKMDKSEESPKTGQINPHRFFEVFDKYLKEGYEIVYVGISSKMSGTYQSALVAKDMLETEDVYVVDSQAVCGGLGVLALKAAILAQKGIGAKEIKEQVENSVEKLKSITCFESLNNLVKGGRLSRTAGAIGTFLGIKLLITIKNGEMAVYDKIRGLKKAQRNMLEYMDKCEIDKTNPVVLMQAATEEENMIIYNKLKEYLEEKNIEYVECEVGCVVGTHSGKDACGIFFLEQ